MIVRATLVIAALGVTAALWRAGAGAPALAVAQAPHAMAPASAAAGPASAPVASAARPIPALPPASSAAQAQRKAAAASTLANIEASVRDARRHGKGEQEVHRLRSAGMPTAQVEALARMEAAETSWRQRVEALQAACAANIGCDDARASFTREELARTTGYAAPALRQ